MTATAKSPPYVLVPPLDVRLRVGYKITTNVPSYALVGADAEPKKGGAIAVNPEFYDNPDTFYTHSITIIQSINPELFEDPDRFYTHTIAYTQFITPELFMDPDRFFSGSVFVFYGDTEVIDVPYEDRCMVLAHEDREMIQTPEDCDMEVLDEETDMYASPRRRRA